jgi:hypothetical protein
MAFRRRLRSVFVARLVFTTAATNAISYWLLELFSTVKPYLWSSILKPYGYYTRRVPFNHPLQRLRLPSWRCRPTCLKESLSKTTKYEDEGILDNFCRLHIILRILSWTSLVVAQRVFPCVAVYDTDHNSCPYPEKNSETWNYIPSLSFCLRAERSSQRMLPKYSLWTKAEERRRDMDSCLAVLSWSG